MIKMQQCNLILVYHKVLFGVKSNQTGCTANNDDDYYNYYSIIIIIIPMIIINSIISIIIVIIMISMIITQIVAAKSVERGLDKKSHSSAFFIFRLSDPEKDTDLINFVFKKKRYKDAGTKPMNFNRTEGIGN